MSRDPPSMADGEPAWIETVSPERAEGALAEVYRDIAGRSGAVGNILQSQSLHPAGLRDHYALYRTLLFRKGALSRSEREAIAVAVSLANECRYCAAHHGASLRRVTRDDQLVNQIVADWRAADLEPRLRAMLELAEKLTLEPRAMGEADLDRLRDAGLEDRAIVEVVEVTAYFNFVNRLAVGLGVRQEGPESPLP